MALGASGLGAYRGGPNEALCLERADRFLDGRTGKAVPLFGPYDDVETAFMVRAWLAARRYFTPWVSAYCLNRLSRTLPPNPIAKAASPFVSTR